MKIQINPIWFYISSGIYFLIRIIEYSTGQVGTPEWVIDFFPYLAFFGFVICDNFFEPYEQEGEEK